MDKKHIPDQSDQEERKDGKGESGEQGKSKRFDLSLAQVMGSAVATVIAAFLAGQLGVYGTFFGAGVVSLVATSGGPIFQHLFRRTGEQIKEVAVPPAKGRTRQLPVRDPAEGWKDDSGLDATQAMRGTGQVPAAGPPPDHTEHPGHPGHPEHTEATRLILSASPHDASPHDDEARDGGKGDGQADGPGGERSPDQVQMLDTAMVTRMLPGARGGNAATGGSGSGAGSGSGPGADDATRLLGSVDGPVDGSPHGPGDGQVPGEKLPGDGEFTGATVHGTRWRGWRRTLLPAVVVFVIAIGGITVYEAIAGHNVSGGKGVSVTDLFRPGGGSSGDSPDAPPATPDPGQSQDGDDGSTGEGDGSDQRSDEPGTGGKQSPEESGSGSEKDTTPTPHPSTSQPGETGSTTDPGNTGDGSGPGDQQDGGNGSGTDKNEGGAGSGQFPQRQQSEPTPE